LVINRLKAARKSFSNAGFCRAKQKLYAYKSRE